MMRYAYLLEHRKIALDILQNEGLLNIESRNKLGDANNFWRSYESYMTKRPLTKWNMLFEDLASLKNYSHLHMQVDNPFFRYMVNRPFR